jgi:penicillin-binding protein 2
VKASRESQGDFSPALIKTNLDRDTALVLMELEPHAQGLRVLVEPTRRYLTGSLLSHVMGYVGPLSAQEYDELRTGGYQYQDFIGKSGVELTYEDVMRGKPGKKLVEVDATGRELSVISERPPIDGSNVVLSIDLDLQQKVADVLQEYGASSENAAAAVMDIKTGEVLAMASLPTFDNNVFSGPLSDQDLATLINSPGKPLVNHSIAERYPPGSTFKTIVGSAALQEGVASPSTTITSRGYITVENEFDPNVIYVYPDWAPLGTLDFYRGIAMSSNVYFYYLSGGKADEGFRGLGEERVAQYARAFGLGGLTGIDLPGESPGLVPDAQWKEQNVGEPWTLGDTYNFGIGQGYVATTPLQMLRAVAAIGNGGHLVTPHVVKEYKDSRGKILQQVTEPPPASVPVDPGNLQVIRDAMRQSVTSGVAQNAAVAGVQVAGKTGTAEFGPDLGGGKHATHGWFIGFAPYDDPQIAVVVFVQHGSGGNDASPAAAKIFDYYFHRPQFAAAKPEGTP